MNIITAAGVSYGLFWGIASFVAPAHAGTLGDVDNDGKVDVVEAIHALQVAVGSKPDENIPDAVAGIPVSRNTVVSLCGNGSSAQDGILTYSWSMTNKPLGSAAVLSDSTIENPTFTADMAGSYIVSLTVHDGDRESLADSVIFTARNAPPIANAGVDQSVTIGDQITLNGSGSSDADGDVLTYSWVLRPPPGSTAVLSNDAIEQPSFTADVTGSYSAELVVHDGDDVSSANTVFINVAAPSDFGTVVSAGQVWMDRNLGASRVARSATDGAAYGDLYQWGRASDGHEKRDSQTTTIRSNSDSPGHGKFILTSSSYPYDWRSPQNDNLWQGASGINNPCPAGFRLPTLTELETERSSWTGPSSAYAYASPLKLVVGGVREYADGSVKDAGTYGGYWSASTKSTLAWYLGIKSSSIEIGTFRRGSGRSVRCFKD